MDNDKSEATKRFTGYLDNRGLKKDTIEYFKLRYSVEKDAIAIPHFKNGIEINTHYRILEDVKNKYPFKTGGEVFLYNTDNIDKENKTCFIFEGEFDMMIAHQLGIKNVLSLPNGTNSTVWKWKEFFKDFEKIYICYDADEVGQKAAKKTAEELGNERCWNISLNKGKDFNEFYQMDGTLEEFYKLTDDSKQFKAPEMTQTKTSIIGDRRKEEAKAVPFNTLIKFKNNKRKCLWHSEKTPSLSWDKKTNRIKCFGCGVSFDTIGFIQDRDSLGFVDAVKVLTPNYVDSDITRSESDHVCEEESRSTTDKTQKFEAHTKSIGELLKIELKETPYIVDGLIVEEDINAITAKTGVGKSLFVLKMAEAIGSGTPFLGQYKVRKKKVLILDLEMSEHSIVERAHTVIENRDCEIDVFYKDNFSIDNKSDIEMLIERIKEENYGVVIIDTLSAAHLKEENSNSEMAIILQEMRRVINETGCTIVFLHHHGKGSVYKSSDKGRGATAIIDKVSSHLSLTGEKKMDEYGNYKLYLTITQEKIREKKSTQPFNIEIFWDEKSNKTSFAHIGNIVEDDTALVRTTSWIYSVFPEFKKADEEYEKYNAKDLIKMGKEQGFGRDNIRGVIATLIRDGILKKGEYKELSEEDKKKYKELSTKAPYYFRKEHNRLFPE